MNLRERWQKLMAGDPSLDQSPVIEWCPWWDKTVQCWEEGGMPKGLSKDEVTEFHRLDPIYCFGFQPIKPGCPSTPTSNGVPIIIRDEEDYDRLKPYFYPEDLVENMKEKILEIASVYEKGELLVTYNTFGAFWFPRSLFGDEAHLYSFYDYPELYHRICEDLLQWQIKTIDEFSKYIKVDFMVLSEDMSYNHGSLISKEHFDEFLLPYYKRLIPEIKKYGTKVFMDSDGDISKMIPWFLEAGFDGAAPLERQAGVDLVELRKLYPDFLFTGGFDKMCLLQGKEAIRQEFERLLPVIKSGKYLISVDHQTPPGVSLENYRYYLQLYREYAKMACKAE